MASDDSLQFVQTESSLARGGRQQSYRLILTIVFVKIMYSLQSVWLMPLLLGLLWSSEASGALLDHRSPPATPMAPLNFEDGMSVSIPRPARIAYLCVATVSTAATTCLFAYRVQSIKSSTGFRHMKPLHIITIAIYMLGIIFSISAAVTTFGVGLIGIRECHAAIILCVAFYLSQKLMLYAFLVERTHVTKTRTTPRHRDFIYLSGLITIIVGFGVVASIAFIWAVSVYDPVTGRCYIGLPARVALPLLTYDISINVIFTAVFLYYVRPFLNGSLSGFFFDKPGADTNAASEDLESTISLPQILLKKVLRKTFWGCIAIMPTTIANMVVLAVMKGHQAGWMCLAFCSLDILWCTIVIHWLTATPEEMSHRFQGSSYQTPGTASARNRRRSRRSQHDPNHMALVVANRRSSISYETDKRDGIRRDVEISHVSEPRTEDGEGKRSMQLVTTGC